MRDLKNKIDSQEEKDSRIIKHFAYAVFSLTLITLSIIYLHPFRFFSSKFVEKGDAFLLSRSYDEAQLQYEKALVINPNDKKAKEKTALVEAARKDILALTDFFEEKNAEEELEKIDLATSVPNTETEALKISKKFIDEGDFQLALLPAETALQMDPNYSVAKEFINFIQAESK